MKTIEPSLGSLAQRTYSTLRDAIINLQFKPGELIRKSELCASLGVSRSPISEAISRLAQEGLVEVFPQAGTYVARFSMDEIREGAFIREALELAAIERLGRQISQEQIVLLRRNIRI
ncbi:MAG TPA: GntR family transcriptional regulator, partial [Rhodobacteraceae bacterium]|nr:GntR family transcriptional regulator [Paracoccaceae bacterium]